jgi:PAS domain S-box-containing protein
MKTREFSTAFASLTKRLDIIDAKMNDLPHIEAQTSNRLLPTLTALTKIGVGSATQISKITGRSRAFESKNLNDLHLMGVLTKHSEGKQKIFRSKQPLMQATFQRFYTILSSMSDAIIILSNDDKIEFVNYAFCEYFGLNELPSMLKGLKSAAIDERFRLNLLLPDQHAIRISEIIAQGKAIKGEKVTLSNGRTCLREAVPIEVDNNIVGWLFQYIDITEIERDIEILRKSEARYKSFIELTGEIGWTTDGEGKIVEDISSWRKYTGHSFKEMEGWGWLKAVHPEDVEHMIMSLKNAIKIKNSYEVEFRLRRFDSVYQSFFARIVPVLNDDRSIKEWVGILMDITTLKEKYQKSDEFAAHLAELFLEHSQREQQTMLTPNSSSNQIQVLS